MLSVQAWEPCYLITGCSGKKASCCNTLFYLFGAIEILPKSTHRALLDLPDLQHDSMLICSCVKHQIQQHDYFPTLMFCNHTHATDCTTVVMHFSCFSDLLKKCLLSLQPQISDASQEFFRKTTQCFHLIAHWAGTIVNSYCQNFQSISGRFVS